jgi:hypothetical protein
MIYYTYAYLRKDGRPYYIGKGKKRRAWSKVGRSISVPNDNDQILILKSNLTEQEAFRHEKYMIFVFGRKDIGTGILRNLTDGGEGASGYKHSEEAKKKLSKKAKGRPMSDQAKAKLSAVMAGKTASEETRAKMSATRKGRVYSEEHRAKISKSNTGKKLSDQSKAKVSEAVRKLYKENPGRHPWAKTYTLTSPDGTRYSVRGCLRAFCEKHRISYRAMKHALNRKQTDPRPNGWSIVRAEDQSRTPP